MIEAVGSYSSLIRGLNVVISSTKTVELRFSDSAESLTDGTRYLIKAELKVDYEKDKDPRFRIQVLSAAIAPDSTPDYAVYRGVFRINEGAGGMIEKQGGELLFYRGDAFSSELRNVYLSLTSGWVTVAIPKAISAYPYRAGDLLYVDGRLYHKHRDVGGAQVYEIGVRAECCHKVDGTEYWERVRAAQHRAAKRNN